MTTEAPEQSSNVSPPSPSGEQSVQYLAEIQSSQQPTVEEAAALVGYITNTGIHNEDVDELCQEIRGMPKSAALRCRNYAAYANLCKLTAPISGATLVDSDAVDSITKPVRITTQITFAAILVNNILAAWFMDIAEPERGLLYWLYQAQIHVLEVIGPFLWGALGSCVYLLKRFSDLAESRLFNEDCLQGWGTRILLGAILGGVIQFLYDSSVFTQNGLQLDASALGFLAGVGVKVVYGAIEKTVAALGEVLNLDSIRTKPMREDAVRKFLAEAMAIETDEEKRKLIVQLLEKINTN